MTRLKDLTIRAQMFAGFGFIVLLILFLSAATWRITERISDHTVKIYNHPMQVRKAIANLKADIFGIRLEYRNVIVLNDEEKINRSIANSKYYFAEANKHIAIIKDRYLGSKTDIENVEKSFKRYSNYNSSLKPNELKINPQEAINKTLPAGEIGIIREQLLNEIEVIDDFAANTEKRLFETATKERSSLIQQLFLLIITVLAISLYIIRIIIRNIRRPILELTTVSRKFKDGNMDIRSIQEDAKNEFGELALAFNSLAEATQTEFLLKNQAARIAEVMLKENDSRQFCRLLLRSLLEETNAHMSAIYLLNEHKTTFEHYESIGLDANIKKTFSANDFEGEFGLVLVTKQMQHIRFGQEHSHFVYKTVSEDYTPQEIITIPIVSSDQTVAIISIASHATFSENNLRLLETLRSTLSARIDGILSYRKIVHFSQNLELKNAELESNKMELSSQANELIEQNIELEMQKKQLDEANKMKTVFLSNMSHELRTPLNSVIALSGVLNRRLANKVPEEEYSYLTVIERNGKQLLSLINDILDLSRIESGREEVHCEQFHPADLISEIADLIKPQAEQKHIELRYQMDKSLPTILTDYDKCRHILQNIVANAVKFTEVGKVEITARADYDRVYFSVKDTGIGINEKDLPNIFDEFKQVDGSNSRRFGGTGLGLAIARKYTELINGNITVESAINKGSEFTLSVPINQENMPVEETSRPLTQMPERKATKTVFAKKDKTILLVEDSDSIIIQMKEMLNSEGYNILIAKDGNQALEVLENQIPDAMILDLMMPRVDGFEVLKRVRERKETDQLPVIILTAKYVNKEELAFLKHNHIHQLIRKGDINRSYLLESVASMCSIEEDKKEERKKIQKRKSKRIDNPSILIVEDNPDNMMTLKAILGTKCIIHEAVDGKDGVEKAYLHKPDLILMDYELPIMNGGDALKEIRKVNFLRQTPVIVVTASAMRGDREHFLESGFDDYISKPIDHNHLKQILNDWIAIDTQEV